MNYKTNFIQKS